MDKEHGLLLSGEMIRAYMADRKTMTRRVMTPHNTRIDGLPRGRIPHGRKWDDFNFDGAWVDDSVSSPAGNLGPYLKVPLPCERTVHRFYPIYEVGDGIWWREAFWQKGRFSPDIYGEELEFHGIRAFKYCATDDPPEDNDTVGAGWCKRPSIHMPQWACRNRSIITARRPERVQDISEADAIREGAEEGLCRETYEGSLDHSIVVSPEVYKILNVRPHQAGFRYLWDSINLERGCGWDANFWNWVIEFERCETTKEKP